MSLIDEALRKARLEAAQKDAERRGLPSPAAAGGLPGRPAWRRSRRSPLTAGAIAAVVLVALSLGAGIYLGRRPGGGAGTTGREAAAPAPAPVGETPPTAVADSGAAAPEDAATETAEREDAGGVTGPRGAAPSGSGLPAPDPGVTEPTARAQAATSPIRPPGAAPVQPPPAPPTEAGAAATGAATSDTPSAPAAPRPPAPGPAATPKPAGAQGGAASEPVYRREAPTASGGKLTLSGIAWRETDPVAVLNGEILGVGEGTAGYSITAIERDRVHLRGPEGTITIFLP